MKEKTRRWYDDALDEAWQAATAVYPGDVPGPEVYLSPDNENGNKLYLVGALTPDELRMLAAFQDCLNGQWIKSHIRVNPEMGAYIKRRIKKSLEYESEAGMATWLLEDFEDERRGFFFGDRDLPARGEEIVVVAVGSLLYKDLVAAYEERLPVRLSDQLWMVTRMAQRAWRDGQALCSFGLRTLGGPIQDEGGTDA